jgi:hypothetical protein
VHGAERLVVSDDRKTLLAKHDLPYVQPGRDRQPHFVVRPGSSLRGYLCAGSFYVKRHGAESDRNILRKVEVETITK